MSQPAVTIVLILASLMLGRPARAQADDPIPCLLDWNIGFDTGQVGRFAADLANACADARAIEWDEKIAAAQLSLSILATDAQTIADLADLIGEWRKALTMLDREKQHLADEIRRLAIAASRAGSDTSGASRNSNSRPTTAPPAVVRGPVRFSVAPGDTPWAPAYLKDTLKGNPGFNSTIATAKGAARLRHEDVETPLQSGTNVVLRPGDIVATGADGDVGIQFNDGSKLNLGTSTEIMWSNTQACLGSFSGFPLLVRGVLTWTEGGNRLRNCPKTAETRHYSVALRGAAFTLKYGESNGRGVTTIAVQDGTVRVNGMYGEEATVARGAPRTFEQPVVSPSAADPAAKAIVDGRLLQQGNRVLVPLGAAGIWIDGTRWMVEAEDPSMPDHRTFESLDGDLNGGLYFDPNVVERDALRNLALSSIQQGSPEARIVREEWRKVGPLSVLYVEIEVLEAGSTDLVIGEYFTGAQGMAALVIQLSKDKLAASRADIAAVLDGLVSVDPFSLRAN